MMIAKKDQINIVELKKTIYFILEYDANKLFETNGNRRSQPGIIQCGNVLLLVIYTKAKMIILGKANKVNILSGVRILILASLFLKITNNLVIGINIVWGSKYKKEAKDIYIKKYLRNEKSMNIGLNELNNRNIAKADKDSLPIYGASVSLNEWREIINS